MAAVAVVAAVTAMVVAGEEGVAAEATQREATRWEVTPWEVPQREVVVAAVASGSRPAEAAPAPTERHSSGADLHHSGTLPCLRCGSSSRLVASIRKPATSFWRVSAGSITSSM